MKSDLVSVIIPVYNGASYLSACIESVLAQSHQNLEIIIVDDGSSDDSLKVAMKFENERIHIISQNRKGASSARNSGLSISKGNFIQFLDADDLLGEHKLKNQLQVLLEKPGYIANCSTIHFYDSDNIANLRPSAYEDNFYESTTEKDEFLIKLWGGYSAFGSMVATHAWLIPKSLIAVAGGWNTTLTTDDDGEFFARIILNCKGIIYCPDIFVYYRKQYLPSLSRLDSEEKLRSLLLSATLKTDHLLSVNSSEAAKLATYKIILDIVVNSYQKYPDIYKTALQALPTVKNNKYVPSIGGPVIQKIARYLGWKTALNLQKFFR